MRAAAIDCGTNSIRLLIADIDDAGGLTDVVRLMRVVRLGEGVDSTGRLSDAALKRTFTAVEEYATLISGHSADKVRFVATSATRDAENRAEFAAGIRRRLGIEPEVVSGDEEAGLSFAGAASVLDTSDGRTILVVDIGGGSTEFVAGTADGVTAARSMDMGCVRYTERFLTSDPPTPDEISGMDAAVDRMISDAGADVPFADVSTLVGVAGSITTVAAHALRLPAYQADVIHGSILGTDALADAATDLLEMKRSARAGLPYMHPGRVDVIGAGALIWRAVVKRINAATGGRVDGAVTSEHDILDGIALSLSSR